MSNLQQHKRAIGSTLLTVLTVVMLGASLAGCVVVPARGYVVRPLVPRVVVVP
jgi:hypothetical protein